MKMAVADLLPSHIVWFNKPNETKINTAFSKKDLESLRIVGPLLNCDKRGEWSKYYDYGKINKYLVSKKRKSKESWYIILAILFIYSIDNYNNKE